MEKNNTVVAVFYDEAQQIAHYRNHGMCCLVDYTPEQTGAEAAATFNANEHVPTSSSDLVEIDVVDGTVPIARPVPDKNASNVPVVNGSVSNTTAPSSGAVSSSLLPTTHGTVGSSTQGLGPLESIFVRITKKSKGSSF